MKALKVIKVILIFIPVAIGITLLAYTNMKRKHDQDEMKEYLDAVASGNIISSQEAIDAINAKLKENNDALQSAERSIASLLDHLNIKH